jgi:hypothetical protein
MDEKRGFDPVKHVEFTAKRTRDELVKILGWLASTHGVPGPIEHTEMKHQIKQNIHNPSIQ